MAELIFVASGCFLVLGALVYAFRTVRLRRIGQTTVGTVVGLQSYSGGTRATTYAPVVEFTTGTGEKVTYTDDGIAQSPPRYKVGDRVPLRYDPENPRRVCIWRPVALWLSPALLLVGGLVFLVLAQTGVMDF